LPVIDSGDRTGRSDVAGFDEAALCWGRGSGVCQSKRFGGSMIDLLGFCPCRAHLN